ncbi:hypothetical protein Dtox_1142 [Desulfofarcimen acetoxidans DSM 771]|uniref:Uncharacterized protein n=1 Tax=Desulfofarcimen acetoxidans (strain ATCC 49208 / DSM 771 / KCTC 5769 / VKM B-1644 / 5575) TaxID=485916 RepID=C8W4G0_DESAS|nr:hypothetical protein [Desulfofarcimen acetoxidans]ACV62028.1 hypothetical protein Dtox_1142 [Desulfofarcimen acetoxidans DSM 771]
MNTNDLKQILRKRKNSGTTVNIRTLFIQEDVRYEDMVIDSVSDELVRVHFSSGGRSIFIRLDHIVAIEDV